MPDVRLECCQPRRSTCPGLRVPRTPSTLTSLPLRQRRPRGTDSELWGFRWASDREREAASPDNPRRASGSYGSRSVTNAQVGGFFGAGGVAFWGITVATPPRPLHRLVAGAPVKYVPVFCTAWWRRSEAGRWRARCSRP